MEQPSKATSDGADDATPLSEQIGILGVHHVAVIVESLERSMAFYQGTHTHTHTHTHTCCLSTPAHDCFTTET